MSPKKTHYKIQSANNYDTIIDFNTDSLDIFFSHDCGAKSPLAYHHISPGSNLNLGLAPDFSGQVRQQRKELSISPYNAKAKNMLKNYHFTPLQQYFPSFSPVYTWLT